MTTLMGSWLLQTTDMHVCLQGLEKLFWLWQEEVIVVPCCWCFCSELFCCKLVDRVSAILSCSAQPIQLNTLRLVIIMMVAEVPVPYSTTCIALITTTGVCDNTYCVWV